MADEKLAFGKVASTSLGRTILGRAAMADPDAVKAAAAAAAKNLAVQGDVTKIPSPAESQLQLPSDVPGRQMGRSIDTAAPVVQPKGPDKG